MPTTDEDAYEALDLDPADRAELEQYKKAKDAAKERQMAAARAKMQAMQGGEGQPEAPPQPETPAEIARERALTPAELDEQKRKESEAHIAAVKAGKVPYAPNQKVHVTMAPEPGSAQALAQVEGLNFEIWRAVPSQSPENPVSFAAKFSPDWKRLRDQLKGLDGDWIADRFEFPAKLESVIGFFVGGQDDYWEFPEDGKAESFEVIVKGSKIFRSEIED